ncbi:uncharacterized protein LOC122959728 [Acropora millepora]|uniref:uncharacterized protein LOC122959728 n=1 Tax=Acropora millepora TaxID=45264 RepID=UPI001CF0F049|nr:uncharacterized protein LOC122959728 [Acropora millepora]
MPREVTTEPSFLRSRVSVAEPMAEVPVPIPPDVLVAAAPAAEAPAAAEVPAAGDNPVAPAEEGEMTIRELQNQLLELKRTSASNSVGTALFSLQQELAKPTPVFDPYKALAGLEALVDLARDNADARAKRFSTILRQCRPLLGKPQFQSILLKLVGDKEDVEVAKAIQKSLRPSEPWGPSIASRPPRPGSSRRSIDSSYAPRPPPTCFNCRRRGHIARFCPRN